ncbi:MAG: hypothetical protein QNJ40_14650 [Xanthomonadales bacterium]|nr:hypothetical protein [Xanthomonadales bacterium]
MTRWLAALSLVFAVQLPLQAMAQPSMTLMDRIAGTWIAADGSARQQFIWGLDYRIMYSRMSFKDMDDWKLVSEGFYISDTIEDRVHGQVVGIDMGVDYFSIVLHATSSEKELVFDNRAHMDDGTISVSRERWTFPDDNSIKYQVFRFEDDKEVPWFGGEWKREAEAPKEPKVSEDSKKSE